MCTACSGLQREGETWWAYPGCPEGRGFDETGDKGCLWIELDAGGGAEAQFLPLAARRYQVLEADVTGRDRRRLCSPPCRRAAKRTSCG